MNPDNPVQPATIRFGDDTTVRWSTRKGDYVLWVCTTSFLTADRESSWTIGDFWEMRDGDSVTITNRWVDLPEWFQLHPLEVANSLAYEMARRLEAGYKPTKPMSAPNVWRVPAGDRLVWVKTAEPSRPVAQLLDMRACALVLGENTSWTKDGAALFGSPQGAELPPTAAAALRVGFKAAVGLGVPRTFSTEWRLGA